MQYRNGNKIVVGSTRSGKSVAECNDIVAAADHRDADGNGVGIVVMDPHEKSLAWNAFQQLVARGHEHRIVYDQLHHRRFVPGYHFLKQSKARRQDYRDEDNEHTAKAFADILCRRGGVNIANQPQKEEWTYKALLFLLSQSRQRPASDLCFAFRPNTRTFKSLLAGCTHQDARDEFSEVADGRIRPGQYKAAARLIDGTCGSQTFIRRCGTTLDLDEHMDNAGILLVEGGIDADIMGTIMGALQIQIINYVRRRSRATPRVLLVLDEATNLSLVSQHETRALAECQKMGLDIHILVQLLDFPSTAVTNGVLANCVRHEWFWNANPSVINKAVEDLGLSRSEQMTNPSQSIRELQTGERMIKHRGRHERIWREKAEMLEDPWGFPKLTAIKSYKALSRIRQTSAYNQPIADVREDPPPLDDSNQDESEPAIELSQMELLKRQQREDEDD